MKDITVYINENKGDKVAEQIKKANEKVEKLKGQLAKIVASYDKILEKYKGEKELHKIVPYEIMANFKYISYKEQGELEKQLGRKLSFPYNYAAYDMYAAACKDGKNKEEGQTIYWDYICKLNELVERIHNKQRDIDDVLKSIDKLSAKSTTLSNTAKLVDALFEKIPQMKDFIEKCGEKQFEFLVKFNEKVKKAWETYKQKEEERREKYGSHVTKESMAAWKEIQKIKPKQLVRTEEQLRREVENWKQREAELMATRITTEFGEVLQANLTLGVDGNVNGVITGTKKSAKIESIFAGGYNIQQLHTRMLIHEK